MRRAAFVAALLAVAGCTGGGDNGGPPAGRGDTRQQPSVTEPGLHVGGYVNIGVRRRL